MSLVQFTKKCKKCGKEKSSNEFGRRSGGISNFRNICKDCMRCYKRVYAQSHRQRELTRDRMRARRANPELKERERRTRQQRNLASPRYALNLAINNAKKRHVVNITTDHLMNVFRQQCGRCAITGIEMTWSRGRIEPTSMSIDKIEPGLGYVEGNVRLLCHAINAFRGRMTDAEMLLMARAIVANMDRKE